MLNILKKNLKTIIALAIIAILIIAIAVQSEKIPKEEFYELKGFYGSNDDRFASAYVYLTFDNENQYAIMTPEGIIEDGSYSVLYEKDGVFYLKLTSQIDASTREVIVNRNEVFIGDMLINTFDTHILEKISDTPTYINRK